MRDPGDIVWLENGEERPFEAAPETRRPWLEESAGWGSKDADGDDDDPKDPPAPPELIWV